MAYVNQETKATIADQVKPIFKKYGIKYVDYKDIEFLKKFLNEQGKMLPRRLSGNSLKYQRKVADAIKRSRQMALLPYVTDLFK